MTNDNDNSGCNIWVIIILIILAVMCERLDTLEHKVNPEPNIEIPINNGK
jgi:hypothetical protein